MKSLLNCLPMLKQAMRHYTGSFLDILCPSQVFARWVWPPPPLSDQYKEQIIDAALQFQLFFYVEGDGLFDQTVTGDEMWIHHA